MDKLSGKRIDYLDTAKGIGILCVCLGHACSNQAVLSECSYAEIISFVTLFHMPLFFFVNGMLYHEKYAEKPLHGMVKKLKAYYIPFIKYNLCFWLFHNLFVSLNLISGQLDSKDYAYRDGKTLVITFVKSLLGFRQRFAGAMWFLECLIIISVVFIVIDYMGNKFFVTHKIRALTIGVGILVIGNRLASLTELAFLPANITQIIFWSLNGLLFFYLGYVFRYYQVNEILRKHKALLIPCLLVLVTVTVVLLRPNVVSSIAIHGISIQAGVNSIIGMKSMNEMSLLQYMLLASVSTLGIVMVLLLAQCRLVADCKVLKVFGQYSLCIMCLQFLAFKAVSLLIVLIEQLPIESLAEYPVVSGSNGGWFIIYTLVGCCLPVLLIKILNHVKTGFISIYRKLTEKISYEKKSCE